MNIAQAQQLDEWYQRYCRQFADPAGRLPAMMQVKVDHSARVADDMADMAMEIEFCHEDIITARALGLFHDIGRFIQYAKFRTFDDSRSIDHASEGLDVIRIHSVLQSCSEGDRVRIESGIRHHNVRYLSDHIGQDELPFIKLIRDADKLDICRTLFQAWQNGEIKRYPELLLNMSFDGPCNPDALAELESCRTIPHELIRSLRDFYLTQLSWVYDINYRSTYQRILDRRIIEHLEEILPDEPRIKKALSSASEFVRRHS